MSHSIEAGIRLEHITPAVQFFWEAFHYKLGSTLGPPDKAQDFLTSVITPEFAISAIDADGALLGVAGFKTETGSFVGGTLRDLQSVYGLWGGLWRGLTLSILERDTKGSELLMDGIFVSESARGQGVGQALLHAIVQEAQKRDLAYVRLDVIDTNPRAKQLYERFGFRTTKNRRLGPLRHIFKFRSATTMTFKLTAQNA